MNIKREEKIQIIEELIDGLYAEFDENLSDREKIRLMYGARVISTKIISDMEAAKDKGEALPLEKSWSKFLNQRTLWRNTLEWITDHLHESYYIEYRVTAHFSWGNSEKAEFESTTVFDDYENIEAVVADFTGSFKPEKIALPTGWYYFAEILDGLTKVYFKRCEFCKKVFFNPTERKRKYCSPKCQSTAAVSRFRAKKQEEED